MILKLISDRIEATEKCWQEYLAFPLETREAFVGLISRYGRGERLDRTAFKTFWIDGQNKIIEFKVRDKRGNWRVIGALLRPKIVLVYAFHKKSQELQAKEKDTIRNRIRRIHGS